MKDVSRYSKVFVKIWSSKDFRSLSDNGKLTFMYLLTSPHRNMGGYYVLPFPYLCFDVGLSEQDARAALQEIIDIGMAMYDYDTHVVLITNWFRYNPIENTNQAKGLNRQLGEMPASFLFSFFAEQVEAHCKFPETVLKGLEEEISIRNKPDPEDSSSESKENTAESTVSDTLPEDEENCSETLSKPFANPSETLSKPFRNPIPNQEQEQEQEQDAGTGAGRGSGGNKDPSPHLPKTTTDEKEILNNLKAVEHYPFEFLKDLEFIRELSVEFPDLDLRTEVKKWRTYKLDNPLSKKHNPRLQIRNWMSKASEFNQDRSGQNGDNKQHHGSYRAKAYPPGFRPSEVDWEAEAKIKRL